MKLCSSFTLVLLAALALRMFLILYGEHFAPVGTRYTDIDYVVFSDAAFHVYHGRSAFERAEYRYTPLLAWILQPNIWFWEGFGKMLFSVLDLICAIVMKALIEATEKRFGIRAIGSKTQWISLLWLFNPITATVSTRGSCDSLISLMVLSTLLTAFLEWNYICAMLLGLCVHFRIYPVIYAIPLALQISPIHRLYERLLHTKPQTSGSPSSSSNSKSNNNKKEPQKWTPLKLISLILSDPGVWLFTFVSLLSFFLFDIIAYHMSFNEDTGDNLYFSEAWMYHLTRTDAQHSFSPWFYLSRVAPSLDHVYFVQSKEFVCWLLVRLSFIPQFGSVLYYTISRFPRIHLIFLINTLLFVSLNKVCTSQYFNWYICLLPSVLPFTLPETDHDNSSKDGSSKGQNTKSSNDISLIYLFTETLQLYLFEGGAQSAEWTEQHSWMLRFVGLCAAWFAANGHWLFWAYRFEIQGKSSELWLVWVASLLFLAVNLTVVRAVDLAYEHRAKQHAVRKSD